MGSTSASDGTTQTHLPDQPSQHETSQSRSDNVEMSDLPPQGTSSTDRPTEPTAPPPATSEAATATASQLVAGQEQTPALDPESTGPQSMSQESSAAPPAPEPASTPTAPSSDLKGTETEAIGPNTDDPAALANPSSGTAVLITLLLTSGARHPYRLDEKYLRKREVFVDDMDPFNITVYQLKELILRDWRPEWDAPPSSPSSIRLIHFGRMLDDSQPLKDCRFQPSSPNVVHMTVKPAEIVDEEEATAKSTSKFGHRHDRDSGEEPTAGCCRCVVM